MSSRSVMIQTPSGVILSELAPAGSVTGISTNPLCFTYEVRNVPPNVSDEQVLDRILDNVYEKVMLTNLLKRPFIEWEVLQ